MEVEAPRSASSEYVTVVSIDGDGKQNYVTVLSIDDKRRRAATAEVATVTTTTTSSLVDPAHPEEVVEVYRLPGERLGFGLKFEGGNKTSERVRRLFIQSCAEQSPASRTKCSWGHLGEGDEVLAIDDAPVTQMTRLECVRRLKESQLVIKLAVRCRGALRPEVVSAERKLSSNGQQQQQQEQRSKVPPELPAAPPPVPPRKLRHAAAQANRGSADGEASPGAKKSWDSPGRSSSTGSSATSSPQSQASYRSAASSNAAKSSSNYESCTSSPAKSCPGSKNDSPKDSPKAHVSPVMSKARHEPPAEAQSYLDARSQDGSSTHGSTSDDTGSSLSTVVDRFSTSSDRFSTTSTTSTASEQFVVQPDVIPEINGTHHHDSLVGNGLVDFDTPDFLLTRLANSEARTHVESRGDVERVTAVVAPNTVLIEETPTLQPPLSFQDAPLSYGHEPRPGIFYTADLAADSRTHFRPIKDDAELVEKVFNGEVKEAPPLPVRNHVNRIAVNQQQEVNNKTEELEEEEVKMPVLPPKPMPRKDVKAKRKRPPPPPPPPRREPVPPVPEARTIVNGSPKKEDAASQEEKEVEKVDVAPEEELEVSEYKTNKVLEIVEMKKAKALSPWKASSSTSAECEVPARGTSASAAGRKSLADMSSSATISIEVEDTSDEEKSSSPAKEKPEDELDKVEVVEDKEVVEEEPMMKVEDDEKQEEEVEGVGMNEEEEQNERDAEFIQVVRDQGKDIVEQEEEEEEEEDVTDESDGDDYYWQSNLATIGEEEETNSLEYESASNEPPTPIEMPVEKVFEKPQIIEDIIGKPSEVTEIKAAAEAEPGETAETAAADDGTECVSRIASEVESCAPEDKKQDKTAVNGRMDNCGGGGQRLPPDGDEFPAAYQEFTASPQQQQHHQQQQQQYQYVTSRETMAANGDVDRGESVVDGTIHVAKTSSLSTAELAPEKRASGNYSVYNTEKSIDVAAYFGQDEDEVGGSVPPPLPLTGPPSRAPERKFSNGELWRQDNKSEKSVKDKIAMFSSQSSLEAPLFPTTIVATATTTTTTSNGRRLSKHKSSDDVFADDNKPRVPVVERTQSSFDLSPTYAKPPPSLPQTSPPSSPTTYNGYSSAANFLHKSSPDGPAKYIVTSDPATPIPTATPAYAASYVNTSPKSLARATSFSDRLQASNEVLIDNTATSVLARTNSLASTFKRPAGEDARKSSLSQLIEQRRKGISKLRGLVIPEKDAVPIDQPIMDLPEIKSRDSILVHQIPRSNIQDKWGSQSSLASNSSTVSSSVRQSGSFKMPAPKILSSYSPAFKRKSLAVYGNSNITATSPVKNGGGNQLASPDAPKSLESICSPTRSDYSFDFVSSSGSPENNLSTTVNSKPKMNNNQRKIGRNELYDDSDNDSAVSSSQSSISRGFSPPMSPVPSDRSTISSERSYLSSDAQQPYPTQRSQLILDNSRGNSLYARSFSVSEKPPAPKPTTTTTTNAVSQIPQRQPLKRSSSSETTSTNASSTSTLSADSLSRRVLKPQSVEAINRKNILASARCRSGRDLNGSPLIQRKFPDDEEDHGDAVEGEQMHNGGYQMVNGNGESTKPQIKIAYIEITENVVGEGEKFATNKEEMMMQPPPRLPPKRSVIPQAKNVPIPTTRPSKPEPLEPSNDMKSWVRAELRSLASSVNAVNSYDARKKSPSLERNGSVANGNNYRSKSSLTLNEPRNQHGEDDVDLPRIRGKQLDDQNDLLTVLTTKSRSRSAIHVEDSSYGKLRSPMSLEDILAAKSISADNSPSKLPRSQSISSDSRNGGNTFSASAAPRSVRRSNSTDSWAIEERAASKIPSLGSGDSRCKLECDEVEVSERVKMTGSKIPMARNLGRRSASVTDMKKVFEKPEMSSSSGTSSPGGQMTGTAAQVTHNRFPSLDSSGVEDHLSLRPTMTSGVGVVETIGVDPERFSGEQFGSISSLASSTSLISQQELAQLVEEATLEEPRGGHDVVVVLLHKENPSGSVGITLAGGMDCETKEITIHRVLSHSIADKDGSVQRGDRILSINGRSMRGLTHRESLTVLKQPRSEVVLVVSRAKLEDGSGGAGGRLRSRTESVETIVEGYETNGVAENTAWGPALMVAVYKDGAGLGFSLEGGRDSPLGDRPLLIKKIFTGGAAEKTGALRAGDQLLEVNKRDVSRMSRIEAWSLMKKLHDGEVNLLVRHPATKSS